MPDNYLYSDTGDFSAAAGQSPEAMAAAAGAMAGFNIIFLAISILMIVGMWKVFTKAGKPGWASLVPFYNMYVMLKIAGKPGWWLLLLFIPIVNIVILFLMYSELSKAFGRGIGTAIGLLLLPYIFVPILGFSQDKYTQPAAV